MSDIEIRPSFEVEQFFVLIYQALTYLWGLVSETDPAVFFFDVWVKVGIVSAVLTPVLLGLIAYVVIRNRQMRTEELEAFRAKAQLPHTQSGSPRTEQWKKIEDMVSSERPSDWRVAILEADIMLDELLTTLGYQGENLGEKLRSVDRGDMRTLDMAWEAHRLRNEIAHGGSDFVLTQRSARQAIAQFRQVFEEKNYI